MHTKILIILHFGWWYYRWFQFSLHSYKKHFLRCEPLVVQSECNYSPYWEGGGDSIRSPPVWLWARYLIFLRLFTSSPVTIKIIVHSAKCNCRHMQVPPCWYPYSHVGPRKSLMSISETGRAWGLPHTTPLTCSCTNDVWTPARNGVLLGMLYIYYFKSSTKPWKTGVIQHTFYLILI